MIKFTAQFVTGLTTVLIMLFTPVVNAKTIMVFGDSFSSAYGLERGQSWVDLLAEHSGDQYKVINASKAGRLLTRSHEDLFAALDQHKPDIVIIALGVNDGNQRTRLGKLTRELYRLIEAVQASDAKAVIFSVHLPNSAEADYAFEHQRLFFQVASELGLAYLAWVEEDYYSNPSNLQSDQWHPSVSAHKKMWLRARGLLTKELSIEFTANAGSLVDGASANGNKVVKNQTALGQ